MPESLRVGKIIETAANDVFLTARDNNYKMHLAMKLSVDEAERVHKHELAKLRQLELEEDTRVKQLIKDRLEQAREKAFEKEKKEKDKDRRTNIEKIDFVRVDHLQKTQQKYKNLDNIAHKAGKTHHREVDEMLEKKAKDEILNAKSSFARSQL